MKKLKRTPLRAKTKEGHRLHLTFTFADTTAEVFEGDKKIGEVAGRLGGGLQVIFYDDEKINWESSFYIKTKDLWEWANQFKKGGENV